MKNGLRTTLFLLVIMVGMAGCDFVGGMESEPANEPQAADHERLDKLAPTPIFYLEIPEEKALYFTAEGDTTDT